MIYSLNTKNKIKESKQLKEARNKETIKSWLDDSINAMLKDQELTISRYFLDSNFGFYVFWSDGFDTNDDSVLHATAQPTYALVAGLKCRNDAEWDGDYMDSPYSLKTGDMYTEDYELRAGSNSNTHLVAEWLLDDYNTMLEIMNSEEAIDVGGLKESVNPADLTDCPECGDVSFDSKRGRCTKCNYIEALEESGAVNDTSKITKLSFSAQSDFKGKDMTNTLCDTLGKWNIEYDTAKKLAGKYYVNIHGDSEIVKKAKIAIEQCGFFKAWETTAEAVEATKNIKEGLSAKEILMQARALLEK